MAYKISKLVILCTSIALLAACASSPIPVSENFPLTVQPKVRSAGHWNLLSKDVAKQTLENLGNLDKNIPLYVALPPKASEFDVAFKEFLITELVKAGRIVHQTPENAVEVSYQTQLVRHQSPRPHFIPGQLTMVAAGLYALYGLESAHLDAQLVGGLGLTAAADVLASTNSGGPTSTELILTTTIANGGRYLVRKTDLYYIEAEDASLFAAMMLPVPAKTIKVVGQ